MLCEVCLKIFRGSFPKECSEHHDSVDSLQQSALENCDICRMFWHDISQTPQPGSEHVQVSTAFSLRPYEDEGTKRLEFEASLPPFKREWIIFCEPTGEDCNAADANKRYDYSDWTASMVCARTWLRECIENHNDCQISHSSERTASHTSGLSHSISKSKPTTFRPTRLIEIGQPEANKVRLRLSSELDSTSLPYATLSHCWGKSKTLRLTSSSFQRFRNGVAISELAKTFQDAISTARSLGLKLLWIDSFCIFQDSREDWQQEAGLMSQVYRHSFLNIAAGIATDSDAGCFRERASTVEPCVVQTAWTDHPNGTYYLYDRDNWFENFERMPLNRRAWVLQELALAPRVLHLCGTQMFWECHGLRACETWPAGLPRHMYMHSLKSATWPAAVEIFGSKGTSGIGSLCMSTDKNDKLTKNTFRGLWRKIVCDYTLCDLTYPGDKLVALSGVAKHMAQLLDIEYCAGLWNSDLVSGLGWYLFKQNYESVFPVETDPVAYRAPSWSWACLDGAISWNGFSQAENQPLFDIISCDVKTVTADQTGAVTSATLQLSGYLATIKLHSDFGNNWEIYCNGRWNSMSSFNFQFDRRPSSFHSHCLPLFIDDLGYLCALLLCSTQAVHGQFRRMGMFRTLLKETEPVDWNQLPHFENESWLEYEAGNGGDRYTVTII